MPVFVACPICETQVEWKEANIYRPFCSEKCKQIDLGAWAQEKYAIPTTSQSEDNDDALNSDTPYQ